MPPPNHIPGYTPNDTVEQIKQGLGQQIRELQDELNKRQEEIREWEEVVRNHEDQLSHQQKQIARERSCRVYYQGIVYNVCAILDRVSGPILRGTVDSPSTKVQEATKALYTETVKLRQEKAQLLRSQSLDKP